MPRSEKWLTELDADRNTLDVARTVLGQRLKTMGRLIKEAVDATADVEAVHDLRVWTRRTEAALVLFKPLIVKKRRKWVRKQLRRLRGAAGAVRDCDVHWKHLNDEPVPNRALLKAVLRERQKARKELRQAQEKLTHQHRFAKQTRKLVKGLDDESLGSACRVYRAFAQRSLEVQANSFFQAAEFAGTDDDALHRLRIAAKRWRYALELAGGVLAKPWGSKLYEQLSEVQDRLGEVHDLEAVCQRIEGSLAAETSRRRQTALQRVLERQQRELAEVRGELGRWWTAERQRQVADCWSRASGRLEATA